MASSDLISDLLRNTDNATESEKSAATSARVESPAVISAPEKEISPEEMAVKVKQLSERLAKTNFSGNNEQESSEDKMALKVSELGERLAMTDFPGHNQDSSDEDSSDEESSDEESSDETLEDESSDDTDVSGMGEMASSRKDALEKLRKRIMNLKVEEKAAARYKAEPRNALYTTRSKVNQVKQMMDQRRIANSRRVRDTRVPRKLETISNTSRTPPVSDEEYARLIKLAR